MIAGCTSSFTISSASSFSVVGAPGGGGVAKPSIMGDSNSAILDSRYSKVLGALLFNPARPVPRPAEGITTGLDLSILANALSIAFLFAANSLSVKNASFPIEGLFLVGIPIALGSPRISFACPPLPFSARLSPNKYCTSGLAFKSLRFTSF